MRSIKTFLLILLVVYTHLNAQVQLEWEPIFTQTNALAFALNPFDDSIIYATKNGNFHVSYDGGQTWDRRGLVPQIEIRNIAVCPADTAVIIMYANGSLLRSSDAGYTWNEVLDNITMDGETIEFHPGSPDSVFYIDFLGGDLWVSADRGASWNKRTNVALTHICSFSINPYDTKKMIAGAGNTRISRSLDGGYTWESVKEGNPYFSEIPKIKWDPTHPDRAYGSAYLDNYFSVFKSTDQGNSWTKPGVFGIPMWALDIDPVNGDVYIGEFQNRINSDVYKSYDTGNSWQVFGDIPGTAVWMIKTANDSIVTALSLDGFFGIGGIYRMHIPQLGYLAGQVIDSVSAIAVEYAQVTVQETGDKLFMGNGTGRYKMAMLPGTYNFTFKTGTIEKTIPNVTISADDTTHLDVQLAVDIHYASLNGRIIDDQGNPVPSKVTLEYASPINIPATKSFITDENGHYQFDSLLSINNYSKLNIEPLVLPYFAVSYDSFDLKENYDILVDYADIFLASGSADPQLAQKYTDALDNAGITWVAVNAHNESDKLTNKILSKTKRKTMLWFDRHDSQGINKTILDSLQSLVENGTNMILVGQNMLEYNDETTFFKTLGVGFAANYTIDGFADPVNGIPGNAVGNGLSLTIGTSTNGSADILNYSPENASAAFYYGNSAADSALVAAVTVNNSGSDAKAVVFGIDLDFSPGTQIAEIISASLDYFDGILSLEEPQVLTPVQLKLLQNYPNPFNPETIISFELPAADRVALTVFTRTGQRVRTLITGRHYPAGLYKIKWDGKSDAGEHLASGVYFCMIKNSGYKLTRKMILIR